MFMEQDKIFLCFSSTTEIALWVKMLGTMMVNLNDSAYEVIITNTIYLCDNEKVH